MASRRVLWQSIDDPGHEWCSLDDGGAGPARPSRTEQLRGTAVLAAEGIPWRISYSIELGEAGITRQVTVTAEGGRPEPVALELSHDGRGRWTHAASGAVVVDDPNALDIDLAFSPSTNSLPIRRLGLVVGERREIAVAWVLFPSFEVVRGSQTYERLGERVWRYESPGFKAELTVDEHGLVDTYFDWRAIASISPEENS
jgi:hypothetical protein